MKRLIFTLVLCLITQGFQAQIFAVSAVEISIARPASIPAGADVILHPGSMVSSGGFVIPHPDAIPLDWQILDHPAPNRTKYKTPEGEIMYYDKPGKGGIKGGWHWVNQQYEKAKKAFLDNNRQGNKPEMPRYRGKDGAPTPRHKNGAHLKSGDHLKNFPSCK